MTFDSVGFAYGHATTPIFRDLSFGVPPGRFLSVVGPSGCGKSTLLRIAAGLLNATSGRVIIEGQTVTSPTPSVGFVFQSDTLLPWRTAVRNIQFGIEHRLPRKAARRRSLELLSLVGLEGFEERYPGQLSGGMKQRVNLARALATDPEVLLMDEPFAALDAQTREEQQQHLLNVWHRNRINVIFVTHDIEEAIFLSDHVIVLDLPPHGIRGQVDIDLPRPRSISVRQSDEFGRKMDAIRKMIARGDRTETTENSSENQL